jgi:hypothetical protein
MKNRTISHEEYKNASTSTSEHLKEAKDWCESNGDKFAPKSTEEETSGPGTKRSQPIPVGVGTASKKST